MGESRKTFTLRPVRRGRLLGSVIGAAALLAAGATLSPAGASMRAASHRSGSGVLQPVAGKAVPLHGGTVSSLNWSGYAVTGTGITGVASTFKVPTAGLVPPGFTATWAGIGGYSTSDLIQAGVGEQSLPSAPLVGPQYFAWWETLPNAET
ncbi:MAG TPA: G1 family glutamic endopeptidase, partial [Acidimicrobiales bacterium]|nr:G1 family glutamic endopeptidase [Acidimicrobiales bacterium]